MRKTEIVEFDGYKYEVRQLACTTSITVTSQLAKMIAPLTKGLVLPKGQKPNLQTIMAAMGGLDIGTIIENVLEKFDEEKTIKLILKLLGSVKHLDSEVEIDGTLTAIKSCGMLGSSTAMDNHFSGDGMKRLFLVIKKSIEVNYADFFPETSDPKSE